MLPIQLSELFVSDLQGVCAQCTDEQGLESTVAMSVVAQIEALSMNPALGRPSQLAGLRELVLSDVPYFAPYRVVERQVQVLRLLHLDIDSP